jgi:hypothetical protein
VPSDVVSSSFRRSLDLLLSRLRGCKPRPPSISPTFDNDSYGHFGAATAAIIQ